MISVISVLVIHFISSIDILWNGVIVLMTIDDSVTKDDVLKLVAINNINTSSLKKSITCTVLIVEIVVVFFGTNYTRRSSRQDICRFYGIRLKIDRGPRYRKLSKYGPRYRKLSKYGPRYRNISKHGRRSIDSAVGGY